ASCANATLTPEIKTYDEANKNLKARSVAGVYSPRSAINTTINDSHNSKIETTDKGPHSITIGSNGTLGSIGNTDRIIYAHASGSNIL
ncbi:autotransporter, partial [Campylobacter sp. BCW_8712]